MADVQVEHGFTRIADELLQALCRCDIPARHIRAYLAMLRLLYGYQRTEDEISARQVADLIGSKDDRNVRRVLADLVKWNMLTQQPGTSGRPSRWGIQKDYEKWSTGSTWDANKRSTRVGDNPGFEATRVEIDPGRAGPVTRVGGDPGTRVGGDPHQREETDTDSAGEILALTPRPTRASRRVPCSAEGVRNLYRDDAWLRDTAELNRARMPDDCCFDGDDVWLFAAAKHREMAKRGLKDLKAATRNWLERATWSEIQDARNANGSGKFNDLKPSEVMSRAHRTKP